MVLDEDEFQHSSFFCSPSAAIPDLEGRTIDNGRLQLRCKLGRGGWGVVYHAVSLTSAGMSTSPKPAEYAVKVLQNHTVSADHHRTISREVGLHNVCSQASPGVLKLYNIVEDELENLLFIILDYCPDGDLLDLIFQDRYIGNDALVRDVFLQLVDAVQDCHDMDIFHRDLKPENILCKDGGRRVLLADFGFATCEKRSTDFKVGSTPFMSPEVRGGLYTQAFRSYSPRLGDIWALGIIFINIVSGRMPWLKASIADPAFATFISSDPDYLFNALPISWELNVLLKKIFTIDPRERIGLERLRLEILGMERLSRDDLDQWCFSSLSRATGKVEVIHMDDGDFGDDDEGEVDMHISNGVVSFRDPQSNLHHPHYHRHTRPHTPPLSKLFTTDLPQSRSPFRRRSTSNASSQIGALLDDEPPRILVVRNKTPIPASASTSLHAPALASSRSESSIDSASESEGPITPEQYAADATPGVARPIPLLDVPVLYLSSTMNATGLGGMNGFTKNTKMGGIKAVDVRSRSLFRVSTPKRIFQSAARKVAKILA